MKSIRGLLLWGLVALPSSSYALDGMVQMLEGDLAVQGGTSPRKLAQGQSLASGDQVSLKRGTAVLRLSDGTLLKLKEGASVTLEAHAGDSTPSVLLHQGGVFALVEKGAVTSKPKFYIRTKSVSMGVRGTEFFTSQDPGKDLWMCVKEGTVEVENAGVAGKIQVHAGEGIVVKEKTKIAPPKSYEWTKNLNWNMDPSRGAIEDHSTLDGAYKNLLRQNYD